MISLILTGLLGLTPADAPVEANLEADLHMDELSQCWLLSPKAADRDEVRIPIDLPWEESILLNVDVSSDLQVLKCKIFWTVPIVNAKPLKGGDVRFSLSWPEDATAEAELRWQHRLRGIDQQTELEQIPLSAGQKQVWLSLAELDQLSECLSEVKLVTTFSLILRKSTSPEQPPMPTAKLEVKGLASEPLQFQSCEQPPTEGDNRP